MELLFFDRLCAALDIVDVKNPDQASPLVLAFVGDTIFDLAVRTLLIETHDATMQNLHRMSSARVRAAAQAQAGQAVFPLLDEPEQAVFLRGRNAKSGTIPKHASLEDYSMATALECLIGWLFLSGQEERMLALLQVALQHQPADVISVKRPFRP